MFAVNNIIFCDRNGSVIDELKKVFQSKTIKFKQNKHKYVTPSFNYESEDIRRIKLAKGLAFMSPANSFLQFLTHRRPDFVFLQFLTRRQRDFVFYNF